MMHESLTSGFATAITGADGEVDLFGAAMIVARLSGDPVDAHQVARDLDLFAEGASSLAGPTTDPVVLAQAVDHQLFSVLGFHGNTEDYTNPENSYLHCVVARRAGIPITLSLIYMEVGQRIGLHCEGIGYPGHFLVRCGSPENPIYVDPFHQGARIDREELLAGLRAHSLNGASPESFLAAVTRRQVLQRMLRNLHASFRDRRDTERWLGVVDLLLCIEPWNAALVGERGMLRYRLGDHVGAQVDLERYVQAAGDGAAHTGALRILGELRSRLGGSGGSL